MPTLVTSLPALAVAGLTALTPAVVPAAAQAAVAISCTVSGQAQYLPGAQRLLHLERSWSRRAPWNCVDRSGSGVTAARMRASFNGVTPSCGGRAAAHVFEDENIFDRMFRDRDRNLANRIIYDRHDRSLADRIIHDREERNLADRIVYDREERGSSDGVFRDRGDGFRKWNDGTAFTRDTAPGGTGTITIGWTVNGATRTSKAAVRIVETDNDTAKVAGTIQSGLFRGRTFNGRFDTSLLGGSGTCVSGRTGSVLRGDFKGQFTVG
ncbi:hypothetical protein ACFFV7_10100 [Nonomuraea spiralis]|uniref:Uncharacterized protein n=1 Tax=Nonomuraea spiralis TaxID=46182 RepID=A0ABV5IAH8_9ACTN|nr:hypothetical protein [Nonomuraea spiralis]GGT04097.1 hypothetical protein GCM10010176_055370 [Nonomuraea spiralis]